MVQTFSILATLVATAAATNHVVEAPAPEYPAGWPAAAPAPAVHEVAPPQHIAPPQHVAVPQHQAVDPWAWEGGNLAQAHVQPVGVTVISINNGGGAEWQQVAQPQHQASPVQGSAPAAVTHEVTVGGTAGLIYEPASIAANMGDIVQFNFLQANHTVTQSTFATPCKLMPDGMDSGFMANPNNTVVPAPAFRMEVTTTEPLWFYCKQRMGTHCGRGMVFSINPTAERTMDQFLQAAVQQNGTGEIPPAAASAAAASVVVAPPASAATPEGGHVAPAAAPAPHEVAGSGQGAPGACSCSCLCGVADYPSGMGIGMWGGLSGAIPMPVSGSASGGAPAPVSY